ncbi:MAG: hypothetical protein ACLFTK_16085 [Anaerolineales bacterium]
MSDSDTPAQTPEKPSLRERLSGLAKRAWQDVTPYQPAMVNLGLIVLIVGIYQAMQDDNAETTAHSAE